MDFDSFFSDEHIFSDQHTFHKSLYQLGPCTHETIVLWLKICLFKGNGREKVQNMFAQQSDAYVKSF